MRSIVTDIGAMRKPCRATTEEEVRDLKLKEELVASIDAGYCSGFGLAANQIGFDLRYAIYLPGRINVSRTDEPIVCLLNPKIISWKDPLPFPSEGCLSLPHSHFNTWRYSKIVFENTEDGKIIQKEVVGIEAVIVFHEIDHMDGILVMDRTIKPLQQGRNEWCKCGSGKKFKKCHGFI